MAAPKNPQTGPNPKKAPKRNRSKRDDILFEEVRAKIQGSQIVNRLNKYVLNEKDDNEKDVKMEGPQVTAALGLLDRIIPKLQATTLTGPEGGPMQTETITRTIVDPKGK